MLLYGDPSLSREQEQHLDSLLTPEVHSPTIGSCAVEDTVKVMALLRACTGQGILPKEMRFYWSVYEVKGNRELYGIRREGKAEAPLGNAAIKTVEIEEKDNFVSRVIDIGMNEEAAKTWYALTKELAENRLPVVIALDERVYSAPVVMSAIPNGRIQISGIHSEKEAEQLAQVLKTGQLPAPMELLEFEIDGAAGSK